jgi:hypothetical protein
MIHPAPTDPIAPTQARGTLSRVAPASATAPAHIVIEFPNTSYELHLIPTCAITTEPGKRIIGLIRAAARRVDVVDTGGKYVEPIFGRPRRVQGRIITTDAATNTLTVDAGVTIQLTLTDTRQRAERFQQGELVSTDVLDGATFTPAG